MGLDALFSPRAVAVVGASNRELTIGYRIIENLLDFGYTGQSQGRGDSRAKGLSVDPRHA